VGLVGLSYIAQVVVTPVDRGMVLQHSVTPDIADSGAHTVAVGSVSATITPLTLFLRNAVANDRICPPQMEAPIVNAWDCCPSR
jgi:manganese transport protein